MNWLDWLLLGALILSAFAGMRVGLFWSMAAFGSLLVGWYFAGNVSNAASQAVEVWTDSTTVQATITVLIYVALMAIMLYAASRAIAAIKPFLSTTTLGVSTAIDRVGGLALGFLVGAMVLGAVVLVAARLTYQIDLDVIDDSVPGELHGQVQNAKTVHEDLERFLGESEVVGALVRVSTALPSDTLGLAPADYGLSLKLLEEALD